MLSKNILDGICSPEDIKSMSNDELNILCQEIRQKLIDIVSVNGGHLASNLGAVELTVALHKVFNTPKDKIIWDVGHQCYTHKMLTGRLNKIHTIRKEDGLSGFPKRNESEYDAFNVGHSSTSISAALGIAMANNILNDDGQVVAVIGDGALSGGLAYEGLNNAGRFKKNFIVILNDNKMSISRNVGSMARYLSKIRMNPSYLRIKRRIDKFISKLPFGSGFIKKIILRMLLAIKNVVYRTTLFEQMGFAYYGPIDGHDMQSLVESLGSAKKLNKPVLIHVITKKGKGYEFAEKDPKNFHGTPSFDITTGKRETSKKSFSEVFGASMCELANDDNRICAITAAMKSGTGLTEFAHKYRERFFDVGIAEEHAVTFAAGLSAGGLLPVFAVYSSFLQRSYDQIIHDAALQNLKVVLAVDRAGIVGEDGETHQGVFDASFLHSIPNVTVFAPSFFDEVKPMLKKAIYDCEGTSAIRYPRGGENYKPVDFTTCGEAFDFYGDSNSDVVIVTYGTLFSYACVSKEELAKKGINVSIIKLNRISPIDVAAVEAASKFSNIFFFEEGIKCGGIGEHFNQLLVERLYIGKYVLRGIDNKFVVQSSVRSALHSLSLDSYGIINTIVTECLK